MLDIKFIRENKELVKEGARKKRIEFDIDELIAVDDKRRVLLQKIEERRAKQNSASEWIAKTEGSEKVRLIAEMRDLKEALQYDEEQFAETMKRWQTLMLQVPNIPDMSVPEGESDEDNQELRTWGEKPKFDFDPKDHMELMLALGMADFERGAKVHGFRGHFLLGDGVGLSFAIWNYALSFFSARGFLSVMPPALARKEAFFGTGFLPQGEDDLYKTQDGDFFAGTAEVPLMGFYMNETIPRERLPVKYLGFSPCYRREAGSYSRDVKGLIRVHEFYKFEQVVLCEASHEQSVKLHEDINHNTEAFIESLGIPYRTVVNCGADLGLGQVKKYDIELWVPKEGKYREISSASYYHDFQTRRLNIRYENADGRGRYAHSLNSTAIPTPRILVSLVENYQQADGSVRVPDALASYMGKEVITKPTTYN